MSELTLALVRFGLLAVLWLFVLAAVSVVRSDIFGTRAARAEAAGLAGTRRKDRRGSRQRRRGPVVPALLVVVDGPDAGREVALSEQPVTFGRGGDTTVELTDDYVSTAHARFFRDEGRWYVEDLGSTNGTYVDGARVRVPTPVAVGVPVRLGKTVLDVRP